MDNMRNSVRTVVGLSRHPQGRTIGVREYELPVLDFDCWSGRGRCTVRGQYDFKANRSRPVQLAGISIRVLERRSECESDVVDQGWRIWTSKSRPRWSDFLPLVRDKG